MDWISRERKKMKATQMRFTYFRIFWAYVWWRLQIRALEPSRTGFAATSCALGKLLDLSGSLFSLLWDFKTFPPWVTKMTIICPLCRQSMKHRDDTWRGSRNGTSCAAQNSIRMSVDVGDGQGWQIFQLLTLSGGRGPVSISRVLSSPPAPEVDIEGPPS